MPAKAKMGFFDQYTDTAGGGSFMKEQDKAFLINNGIKFEIYALQFEKSEEYDDRWVAFVRVPNPETGEMEERKIGYPVGTNVPTRDNMLAAMKQYFDTEEDPQPVEVKMSKPGRAILIHNANA